MSVSILYLGDDGILREDSFDGQPCYRYCATDNRGDPRGLLTEMRNRKNPTPWESCEARDAAVEIVQGLKRLPARTRKALVKHIGRTPYAQFSHLIPFTIADGKPKFAHYRAARCHPPAWGQFLDDLRQEYKEGRPPVPYASKALRDAQAERIKGSFGDGLTPELKEALLAHVARSPYLSI